MDAKAGESGCAQLGHIDVVLPVIELFARREGDVAHTGGRDFVNAHRALVMKARVKEHQLERQAGIAPDRMIGAKANIAILVIIEIEELFRKLVVGNLLRRIGHRARLRDDVVQAERSDRKRRRSEQAQRQSKRFHHCGHANESGSGRGRTW